MKPESLIGDDIRRFGGMKEFNDPFNSDPDYDEDDNPVDREKQPLQFFKEAGLVHKSGPKCHDCHEQGRQSCNEPVKKTISGGWGDHKPM